MQLTDNGIKLLDILVKGGFGSLIIAGVAYYGNSLQVQRQQQEEDSRQLQSSIALISHQKELDVDIGVRLLTTLMDSYFQQKQAGGAPTSPRQQMLLLRLVALNFEDVPIRLKPLFEDLDERLSTPADKQTLRGIAREVAQRQAFRMTTRDAYDSGPREVSAGDSVSVPEMLLTVKIGEVGAAGVSAVVTSSVGGGRTVGPFEVTWFDQPLVDNTLLGDNRVALVLLAAGAKSATVRIIAFPKHLADDRFDIKEMSRVFQDRSR
jgi:hypothetical protein